MTNIEGPVLHDYNILMCFKGVCLLKVNVEKSEAHDLPHSGVEEYIMKNRHLQSVNKGGTLVKISIVNTTTWSVL